MHLDGGVEQLHLGAFQHGGFVLLDVHQNIFIGVTHFQKPYLRCLQGRLQQGFQYFWITGQYPVLGGGGQLVGDQLACVDAFITQVLQPRKGEKAGQQDRQQQGRAQADE